MFSYYKPLLSCYCSEHVEYGQNRTNYTKTQIIDTCKRSTVNMGSVAVWIHLNEKSSWFTESLRSFTSHLEHYTTDMGLNTSTAKLLKSLWALKPSEPKEDNQNRLWFPKPERDWHYII
jgi:hypothetical protein